MPPRVEGVPVILEPCRGQNLGELTLRPLPGVRIVLGVLRKDKLAVLFNAPQGLSQLIADRHHDIHPVPCRLRGLDPDDASVQIHIGPAEPRHVTVAQARVPRDPTRQPPAVPPLVRGLKHLLLLSPREGLQPLAVILRQNQRPRILLHVISHPPQPLPNRAQVADEVAPGLAGGLLLRKERREPGGAGPVHLPGARHGRPVLLGPVRQPFAGPLALPQRDIRHALARALQPPLVSLPRTRERQALVDLPAQRVDHGMQLVGRGLPGIREPDHMLHRLGLRPIRFTGRPPEARLPPAPADRVPPILCSRTL